MSERTPSWAKKPPQKCGTCRWLKPREEGKKFHHTKSYPCCYQFPAINWPSSVSINAWNSPRHVMTLTVRGYMSPGDGKDCPCWEAVAPTNEMGAEQPQAASQSTHPKEHP